MASTRTSDVALGSSGLGRGGWGPIPSGRPGVTGTRELGSRSSSGVIPSEGTGAAGGVEWAGKGPSSGSAPLGGRLGTGTPAAGDCGLSGETPRAGSLVGAGLGPAQRDVEE